MEGTFKTQEPVNQPVHDDGEGCISRRVCNKAQRLVMFAVAPRARYLCSVGIVCQPYLCTLSIRSMYLHLFHTDIVQELCESRWPSWAVRPNEPLVSADVRLC